MKEKIDQVRQERKANDTARKMMQMTYELTPLEAMDALAKATAMFIESCGTLGIDTDELEDTLNKGTHMLRKDIKEQLDNLRSIRPEKRSVMDQVAFEANILKRKMHADQINKAFAEKHQRELHTICKDLKNEQLNEVFLEFKKVMEKLRQVAPGLFEDKFKADMEILRREFDIKENAKAS
jgi:hypothetical protein